MTMNRHAYLIMAHKNWNQLKKLIELLDDERNDIFIHIDAKSQLDTRAQEMVTSSAASSKITFVERVPVQWGDYSVIRAELNLLRAAANGNFQYYHLLSGMDLPLKPQDEIHAFFDRNSGKEYIQYLDDTWTKKTQTRVRYYWYFQDKIGNRKKQHPLYILQRLLLGLQKLAGVNRCREYNAKTGAQWFSITNELAAYLCKNEMKIEKRFSRTFCPDEWMVQTLAFEYGFVDSSHYSDTKDSILRLIDWERGAPYTLRIQDYDELMASGCLFARKFDETVDEEIIEKICETLSVCPSIDDISPSGSV